MSPECRRFIARCCVVLAGCTGSVSAGAAISVIDAAGHAVTLPGPARRVLSLAPSITEMVFAAGGGAKLVGVMSYSDYPADARKLPRIGDASRFDLERIVQLKPDLILAWQHGNNARELERLAALGIPMFYLEPRRMEDVPLGMERIATLLGTQDEAFAAARMFRERLAGLRARYAKVRHVSVFYQIARQPLLSVNDDHLIADVLHLCGGENVFGKERSLVPQLSTESVVTADPEVIMSAHYDRQDSQHQTNQRDSRDGPRRAAPGDALDMWRRFGTMRAVRDGQLWTVPADFISRNGPRILDGVEAVCQVLDSARSR